MVSVQFQFSLIQLDRVKLEFYLETRVFHFQRKNALKKKKKKKKRERERERERQTETERERGRDTDIQTDRHCASAHTWTEEN